MVKIESQEDYDIGHGRIETRKCSILIDFQFIENKETWGNLSTIIKIESKREFKNSHKSTEANERFYIASFTATANEFYEIIRKYWSIENKLHWCLDISFSEDKNRKRVDNALQNFSTLNKIDLNLLKNKRTLKVGIKGK